jgi:hypothetical protein
VEFIASCEATRDALKAYSEAVTEKFLPKLQHSVQALQLLAALNKPEDG